MHVGQNRHGCLSERLSSFLQRHKKIEKRRRAQKVMPTHQKAKSKATKYDETLHQFIPHTRNCKQITSHLKTLVRAEATHHRYVVGCCPPKRQHAPAEKQGSLVLPDARRQNQPQIMNYCLLEKKLSKEDWPTKVHSATHFSSFSLFLALLS